MQEKDAFPKPESWWKHFVSYGETDALGIVYYGNYLHWFEQARCHLLREVGLPYSQIINNGLNLPVREAYCRYRSSARFEQEIAVRTGIGKWRRASLTFQYEIYNLSENNQLMTTGYTQHPCVDSNGKLIAVPSWLKDIFLS